MNQLAVVSHVCYNKIKENNVNLTALITVDDITIPLALINNSSNYPILTKTKKDYVLVKKIGFSLNYRDKSVIKHAWNLLEKRVKGMEFLPIGSEFIGKIIDKSKYLSEMKIGSLVIPNCTYNETSKGIPTNCSSKEYQYFEKSELSVLDSNISVEKASVLGIGMITAHSMIRKAKINKGDRILITSITSSTSQFVLNLLKTFYTNEIYAISFTNRIKKLDGLTKIYSREEILTESSLRFDVVFDPFADTYIEHLIGKLNFGARYVTCGIYSQTKDSTEVNLQKLLHLIISKNIMLIGNCLGDEEDMQGALALINNGVVDIPFDRSYKYGESLQDFIDASFSVKPRLGKVAYMYDTNEFK